MKTKNFIFIILLIFIIFALSSQTALAQDRGRPLEVRYPNVPSADLIPQETTTPVPEYVQYIYYFLLGLSGIIALGVLIYAGFQYFTSAGNPEKINEAKSRITAALLGLLILIGSYLILYSINPNLVSFNLPRLRPIIPKLPSGVLLCKRDVPVFEAWDLEEEYYALNTLTEEYYTEAVRDEQREIRNESKALLEEIALYCYTARSSGDISQEFDNKVTVIYFIPSYSYIAGAWHSTEYGAVLYDETDKQGTSYAYYLHLLDPYGKVQPYSDNATRLGIRASSIIPFKLIYEPDPGWNVTLYKDLNYNDGVAEEDKETLPNGAPPGYSLPGIWWDYQTGWPWSPKSMKTEGDLLVVLETPEHESESFFSQEVPNLEAYDNIIEWGRCESYEGERRRGGERLGTGWGGYFTSVECAHAASTGMVIISAEPL